MICVILFSSNKSGQHLAVIKFKSSHYNAVQNCASGKNQSLSELISNLNLLNISKSKEPKYANQEKNISLFPVKKNIVLKTIL